MPMGEVQAVMSQVRGAVWGGKVGWGVVLVVLVVVGVGVGVIFKDCGVTWLIGRMKLVVEVEDRSCVIES